MVFKKIIYLFGEIIKIMSNKLQKGDTAPNFTVNNYNGTKISLSEFIKQGRVFLVLIRGFS